MLVAYNAAVDLLTILFDALVVTDAVNPSLAEQDSLPEAEEIEGACRVEQGLVAFTMFACLGSVLLLSADRFVFIVFPLRYESMVSLRRALLLALTSTVAAVALALWYSLSVELPWDKAKNFRHVAN